MCCLILIFGLPGRIPKHPAGRPWKYNEKVNQYYIICDDQISQKKGEKTIEVDEHDLPESWPCKKKESL